MSAIFVTGTDTGVGKTLISKALVDYFVSTGIRVSGMKPVAAGAIQVQEEWRNDDAELLLEAMNTPFTYAQMNPYVFDEPIAPHIAAKHQGVVVETTVLDHAFNVLLEGSDKVIVEGAGGWQVPLNQDVSLADWVSGHQWPVILVVGIRLGCLNHAQLTYLDILQKKNPLLGWVANIIDPDVACEDDVIQHLTLSLGAPLLGVVPFLSETNSPDVLKYLKFDQL